MRKVVIDTNVFLSGILYGGNPQKILEAWLNKQFILCLSPELKAEILDKLLNKFFLAPHLIKKIEEALDLLSHKYVPQDHLSVLRDAEDNFLLELAQEAHADFLISGDKNVLSLKQYKSTKIVTPLEFLQSMNF